MKIALSDFVKRLTANSLEVAERGSALAQLLSAVEAYPKSERDYGGVNDWRHTRYLDGSRWSIDSDVVRECVVKTSLTARIAGCVTLLLPTGNRTRLIASSAITITNLVANKYTINGSDGADQFAAIILAASAFGRTNAGKNKDLSRDFIAAQTVLSYFVAGSVKWLGSEWRNGTALERVMRTKVYGSSGFYKFLRTHPRIAEFLTYKTVMVEAFFPLLMLFNNARKAGLAAMFTFHLANAYLMGLGRFLLVFTATYPAVISSAERSGKL